VAMISTEPQFRKGFNGNYYFFCQDKAPLVGICQSIGKAPGSIYFSDNLGCWAVRIVTKRHKAAAGRLDIAKKHC
jgi:hypothetical protein